MFKCIDHCMPTGHVAAYLLEKKGKVPSFSQSKISTRIDESSSKKVPRVYTVGPSHDTII
jgi:hypothetical protein